MVLLIDVGDFLFNFYQKNGVLSDKEAVDAFVDAYNKLSEIPRNILSKVRLVIFMNSAGYLLEIRDEILPKAMKLLSKKPKTEKLLSKTFNQELKVIVVDLVTSDDHFALLEDLQQPAIQKMGIFFFDTLLTNSMAKFLIRCPNVLGYRKIKKDKKIIWEKIGNVEKYLTIVAILHQKFIGKETIKENYFETSENQQAGFMEDLKKFKEYKYHNIHIINFDKDDKNKLRHFLDELKIKLGNFQSHYCAVQGKEIPVVERVIIMDFEQLKDNEQREVLANISQDKYDNILILIIVENQIDVKDFPKVNIRVEFSYADVRAINELSLKVVNNEIKEFDDKINNHRNIISKLDIDDENKGILLKKIDDVSEGGNLFNSEAINYWYDVDLLETKGIEDIRRTTKEWGQLIYGQKNIVYYEINLDKKNNVWLIKKNGIQLEPINFKRYEAIKYLVYLNKHYSDGNKISYNKLEEVVHNWGKIKKEELTKVIHSTVADKKSRLLKNHPQFEPLRKFLILGSKESGCYYIKNDTVVIELGNFEIPDAI